MPKVETVDAMLVMAEATVCRSARSRSARADPSLSTIGADIPRETIAMNGMMTFDQYMMKFGGLFGGRSWVIERKAREIDLQKNALSD